MLVHEGVTPVSLRNASQPHPRQLPTRVPFRPIGVAEGRTMTPQQITTYNRQLGSEIQRREQTLRSNLLAGQMMGRLTQGMTPGETDAYNKWVKEENTRRRIEQARQRAHALLALQQGDALSGLINPVKPYIGIGGLPSTERVTQIGRDLAILKQGQALNPLVTPEEYRTSADYKIRTPADLPHDLTPAEVRAKLAELRSHPSALPASIDPFIGRRRIAVSQAVAPSGDALNALVTRSPSESFLGGLKGTLEDSAGGIKSVLDYNAIDAAKDVGHGIHAAVGALPPLPAPYLNPRRSGGYAENVGKQAASAEEFLSNLTVASGRAIDKATGNWVEPINVQASDISGQEGTSATIVSTIRSGQPLPEEIKKEIKPRFLKSTSRNIAIRLAQKNGHDVDEHSNDMDIIYAAYDAHQTGAAKVFNVLAKDAAAIAFGVPAGAYGFLGAASHGVTGEGGVLDYAKQSFIDPYVELAKNPGKTIGEHPLISALQVAPFLKAGGIAVGRTLVKPKIRPYILDRKNLEGARTVRQPGEPDTFSQPLTDASARTINRGNYSDNIFTRPIERLADRIMRGDTPVGRRMRARQLDGTLSKDLNYAAASGKAEANHHVAPVVAILDKLTPDQQKILTFELNNDIDIVNYADQWIKIADQQLKQTKKTDVDWEKWQAVKDEFVHARKSLIPDKTVGNFMKEASKLQYLHDVIRQEMGMFDTGTLMKKPTPGLHNPEKFDVAADIADPKKNAENLNTMGWIHYSDAESLTRGEFHMGAMNDASLAGPGLYLSDIGDTPYEPGSRTLHRVDVNTKAVVDLETDLHAPIKPATEKHPPETYTGLLDTAMQATIARLRKKFGNEEVDAMLARTHPEFKTPGGIKDFLEPNRMGPTYRETMAPDAPEGLPWWAYKVGINRGNDHRASKYNAYHAIVEGIYESKRTRDDPLPEIFGREFQREVNQQLEKRGFDGVSHEGGYHSQKPERYQVLVLFGKDAIKGIKSSHGDPVGDPLGPPFPLKSKNQTERLKIADKQALRREVGNQLDPGNYRTLRQDKIASDNTAINAYLHGYRDSYGGSFDTHSEMLGQIEYLKNEIALEEEKAKDTSEWGGRDSAKILDLQIQLHHLERRDEGIKAIKSGKVDLQDMKQSAISRSISDRYEEMAKHTQHIENISEHINALTILQEGHKGALDALPDDVVKMLDPTYIPGQSDFSHVVENLKIKPKEIQKVIETLREKQADHELAYIVSNPLSGVRTPIRPETTISNPLRAKVERALSSDPMKNAAKWLRLNNLDQLRTGNFDTSTGFFVTALKAPFLVKAMSKAIHDAIATVATPLPKSGIFKVDYAKGYIAIRTKPSTRRTVVGEGEWSDMDVSQSLYDTIEVHPMKLGKDGEKVVPASVDVDASEGWQVVHTDDLHKIADIIKRTEPRAPTHGWHKGTDAWRYQALNLRLGYLVNNVIGNVILAVQSGASARDFIKASYKLSGDKYNRWVPAELTHAGFNVNEVGQLSESFTSAWSKPIRSIGDRIMEKNIAFENFARRAAYIGESRRLSSKEKGLIRRITRTNDEMDQFMAKVVSGEATDPQRRAMVDKINDFMGDFISRPYSYNMFLIAPFYRWLGHMLKLQVITGPTKYPARFAAMALLGMQGMQQMNDTGTSLRPDTLGTLAIGSPNLDKYGNALQLVARTSSQYPEATAGQILAPKFRNPLEGLAAGAINSINPLAKFGLEAFLGRDLSRPPGEDYFKNAEGKPVGPEDVGDRAKVLANRLWGLVPLLNMLQSAKRGARDTHIPWLAPALKPKTGAEKSQWPDAPNNTLADILAMFGVPRYEYIPVAGPAAEKRAKLIKDLLKSG